MSKVTGYVATTFENVTQGDAVYARAADGFIGKAIGNDTFDKAKVAGFAETTEASGSQVRILVRGIIATSGLNFGNEYFLSASSAGSITETPPTGSGNINKSWRSWIYWSIYYKNRNTNPFKLTVYWT